MFKKTITYTDYNGNERKEDHYFNLTKAEMIEYDAEFPDGVIEYLTRLVNLQDKGKLIKAFKDLILRSYGEKLDNGKFIKSQEIRDAFMATEAYSELFMEVVSSEESMAAFVNAIVPKVPAQAKDSSIVSISPAGGINTPIG